MPHAYIPTSEVVKSVREQLKVKFPDVKFRVYQNRGGWTGSFDVCVVSAPYQVFRDGREFKDQIQCGHGVYHWTDGSEHTKKGLALMKGIKAIIDQYHWDESEPQIDYFSCAFYYHINVGSAWDKPFVKVPAKAKKVKK